MRNWNGLPTFVIGTAGTSIEVKSVIIDINRSYHVAYFDFISLVSEKCDDILVSKGVAVAEPTFYERIEEFDVLGVVIPFGCPIIKEKVYNKIAKYNNIVFPNIIHPTAIVGENVDIGYGNYIAAGVTISPNVRIGNFCLINNNCNIGHDVIIEDYAVINPLAAISGNVHISHGALIGGHSAIIQDTTIGKYAKIGLGAFVIKDVPAMTTVICEPAKSLKCDTQRI